MPAEEAIPDSMAEEEALANRSVIRLSPQAAQAFTEALARPTRVNVRLAAALACPRQFRWAS